MKIFKRICSFALAVSVAAAMCATAFADKRNSKYIALPTDIACEISVEDGVVTVTDNRTQPKSYNTKDSALNFKVDAAGLNFSYTNSMGWTKQVVLGKDVKNFEVTGAMNELALSDSLNYNYVIDVDATINNMTITGDCKVTLSQDSSINNLGIFNEEAKVIVSDGAKIKTTNKEPASTTVLEVKIRDYNHYTTKASYDAATNVITLPACIKDCTVAQAVIDTILSVREKATGETVAGKWYWPMLDGSSTESGKYIYRFSATDNEHKSVELTVNFISCEDKAAN